MGSNPRSYQRILGSTTHWFPEDVLRRCEQDRESHRRQREVQPTVPLFVQPVIRCKMANFHCRIAVLQVSKCSTCLERFPGLNVKPVFPDSDDTECVRCRQDKHIPKTYSSGNNMDPGPVPSELQVHIQSTYMYMYTCMLMCRYVHVYKLLTILCIYTIYV